MSSKLNATVGSKSKVDRRPKERTTTLPATAKAERRKQVDPTTCERDYSDQEIDFMRAMDDYKRKSGRQFPTWSEVLEVFIALGYRKVAETSEIDHTKRRDY